MCLQEACIENLKKDEGMHAEDLSFTADVLSWLKAPWFLPFVLSVTLAAVAVALAVSKNHAAVPLLEIPFLVWCSFFAGKPQQFATVP